MLEVLSNGHLLNFSLEKTTHEPIINNLCIIVIIIKFVKAG